MKKIFTLFIGIVFSITVLYTQEAPPQAFSFKATIKDKYGLPVILKKINLRITILQGDMNGGTVYSEYFTPTTNLYSQVDVEIGRGSVLSGIFSSVDWSADEYFLKIEVDTKGGTNYQLLSVTQLLSVPYALYAGAAGNGFSGNYRDLIGAPILAVVATTGNYNDLFGKPTLFSGDYNDLTSKPSLFSGNYEDLFNKPTLFDGTWSSLTGKPSFSTVAMSGSWNDLINRPTTLDGYGITDALSNSHPASGITLTNITNWNSAFSWGNHSGLYRPVSYVPAWSEIIGKPTFTTVATSGSYNDLNNKPAIDGSETKVLAGNNVTILGEGTEGNPYVISSAESSCTLNLTQVLSSGNNASENNIKNLADPVDAKDAATKAYVDVLLARIEVLELVNEGFTDSRDGNHYNVVKIGNQVWMAENLKYLPSVVGPVTGSQTTPYYYVYGYDGTIVTEAKATSNYATYGVLYNWPAAMNGAASSTANPSGVQGVCPTGWHLPSDAEWKELTDYLGGASVAGGKLKETGTTNWNSPNTGTTNITGFTALPGGCHDSGGTFYGFGSYGYWWSATEYYTINAGFHTMHYDNSGVLWTNFNKMSGFSVRCVRD